MSNDNDSGVDNSCLHCALNTFIEAWRAKHHPNEPSNSMEWSKDFRRAVSDHVAMVAGTIYGHERDLNVQVIMHATASECFQKAAHIAFTDLMKVVDPIGETHGTA
jgi:hypothetical protein